MSGKQDKISRRLTADVDKKMKRHLENLEEAKKIDHAKVIGVYNQYLRTMPIRKKLAFIHSLLLSGIYKKCMTIIYFWK